MLIDSLTNQLANTTRINTSLKDKVTKMTKLIQSKNEGVSLVSSKELQSSLEEQIYSLQNQIMLEKDKYKANKKKYDMQKGESRQVFDKLMERSRERYQVKMNINHLRGSYNNPTIASLLGKHSNRQLNSVMSSKANFLRSPSQMTNSTVSPRQVYRHTNLMMKNQNLSSIKNTSNVSSLPNLNVHPHSEASTIDRQNYSQQSHTKLRSHTQMGQSSNYSRIKGQKQKAHDIQLKDKEKHIRELEKEIEKIQN